MTHDEEFAEICAEIRAAGYGVVKARKSVTRRPPGWASKKQSPKTYGQSKDGIPHRRRS